MKMSIEKNVLPKNTKICIIYKNKNKDRKIMGKSRYQKKTIFFF